MKSTLRKDLFREIRKSKERFFSILAIVAIGVAFFAGVTASSPDMMFTADKYYDDTQMRDYQVLSNFGITKQDVEALRNLEGIEAVVPNYSKDVIVRLGAKELVVKTHGIDLNHMEPSDPQFINQPVLTQGRMPEKSGECVVEEGRIIDTGLHVGDTITIESGNEEKIEDSFAQTIFTIVGLVNSPLYLSHEKGTSTIGSGQVGTYMIIPMEDYKIDVYTEVNITAQNVKELNSYESVYFDTLSPLTTQLETLGDQRAELRRTEIVNEAKEKYDEGKVEYEEGKKTFDEEIAKAEQKIEDGKEKLIIGQATLESSKQMAKLQIEQGQLQLDTVQKQIDTLNDTYVTAKEAYQSNYGQQLQQQDELKTKVANQEAAYALKQQELVVVQEKLTENQTLMTTLQTRQLELQAKASLHQQNPTTYPDITEVEKTELAAIPEQLTALQQENIQLQSQLDELTTLETELNMTKRQLSLVEQTLAIASSAMSAIEQQLQSANDQMATQRAALETAKVDSQQQLAKAQQDIEKGQADLAKGQVELIKQKAEGQAKLDDAYEELVLAQDKINQIEEGKWYILDRQSQYSYMEYKNAADRMSAIAKVFPVFFFLVAGLVCLTSMTRMVDEQRSQIGTMKALGYSTAAIASKYVCYAGIASLLGCALGLGIGLFLFPWIIYTAWLMMYVLPPVQFVMQWPLVISTVVISMLITTLAAFGACYKELVETPSLLMRPKPPKNGKKIMLERIQFIWSKLSFTSKVTARNIFRYKKRFLMTVLGISGCTALLVAGFGIKDSISKIVDAQFGTIFHYDGVASINKESTEQQKEELTRSLNSITGLSTSMEVYQANAKIVQGNKMKDVILTVTSDPKAFSEFVSLHSRTTLQEYSLSSDGAILSEKTAKDVGVGVGDTLELENEKGLRRTVEVAAITENYLDHYIYMTSEYYRSVYDLRAINNTLLLRLDENNADAESLVGQQLLTYDAISSLSFYTNIAANFESMVESLNYIVVVLIISAGLLAFVVLYNLTNVNISERLREIATLKVLGFYDKEVNTYVYKENIILTLIGSLVGLLLGKALHLTIMIVVELDNVMFGRIILPQSYLYSLIITMLFAVMVNVVMKKKLRQIPMVESLKSVE